MLEFMRPFFISRSEYENNRTKELIKAYAWIRENNNSIPDDILDLMYNSALERVSEKPISRFEYINESGRVIVERGEFETSLQDNGATLKVFKK